MEFQALNRNTENLLDPKLQKAIITVSILHRHFEFNKIACEKLGVWVDDYVELLLLQNEYMVVKSKPPHGYKLGKGSKSSFTGEIKHAVLRSAAAVRIFKEHYKMKQNRLNFYLVKTAHEYKGNPVFEMIKTILK